MHVRPVLDLLGGVVVRGVGGQRDQYRPIASRLTTETSALAVAKCLAETFGFRDFYVADLDAILHGRPNFADIEALTKAGFRLAIDAGAKTPDDVARLLAAAADTVIIGLESLSAPDDLLPLVELAGPERLLFSVDLKAGRPLATSQWPTTPAEIIKTVLAGGIRRLLVLDLQDVGVAGGGTTQPLIRTCRRNHDVHELWAGGGVRGPADLKGWHQAGVDELLVASALHDGQLAPADVAEYVA